MSKFYSSLYHTVIYLMSVGLLASNPIKTNAAILITFTDNGNDLIMKATGSYDLSSVSEQSNSTSSPLAFIFTGGFGWALGEGFTEGKRYFISADNSLTRNSSVFTLDSSNVTVSNPFIVNLNNNSSGVNSPSLLFRRDALSIGMVDEMVIFPNTTLESLGMIPGENITLSWEGDSAEIQVIAPTSQNIPEPTLFLGLLAFSGVGLLNFKKHNSQVKR